MLIIIPLMLSWLWASKMHHRKIILWFSSITIQLTVLLNCMLIVVQSYIKKSHDKKNFSFKGAQRNTCSAEIPHLYSECSWCRGFNQLFVGEVALKFTFHHILQWHKLILAGYWVQLPHSQSSSQPKGHLQALSAQREDRS